MTAISSTQLPLEYSGRRYSGVYSVSGSLMIARIPGVGSKSIEIGDTDDADKAATDLLMQILKGAEKDGLL